MTVPHPVAYAGSALTLAAVAAVEWYAAIPTWVVALTAGLFLGGAFAWAVLPVLWRRTGRAEAEAAVQAARAASAETESRDLYDLLAQTEAVLEVDSLESGVVVRASPHLLALTGVPDPTGRPFILSVHPDHRERTADVVRRAVASGERIRDFVNLWGPEGRPSPPLDWTQIGDAGRIWLARDATPRVRAEARAASAETEIEAVKHALFQQAAPQALIRE